MCDWREDMLCSVKNTYNMSFEKIFFIGNVSWDHEHCSICFQKIGNIPNDSESEGYYCRETNDWICRTCFFDFKNKFNWLEI